MFRERPTWVQFRDEAVDDHHRAIDMAERLAEGLLDYGPALSRFLLKIVRRLSEGRPLTENQVRQMIGDLGIEQSEALGFLSAKAERNSEGAIVGIAGLSLNKHPHRLILDGVRLSAWCAEDTLFLPYLLGKEAQVLSRSPASGEVIRLRVAPDGVREVAPSGTVISLVLVDPERDDMSSVEAIWNVFCRHVHFFATREEAERWSAGREEIAIVSVQEGFEVGQRLWSRVLSYAA